MLRTTLVICLIITGYVLAVKKPLYALMFYTWNAYFRPESWVWDRSPVMVFNVSYVVAIILIIGIFLTKQRLVFNFRVFLMGFFLLLCWIGTSIADVRAEGRFTVNELTTVFLISYLYLAVITDVKKLRWMITVIVLSLGLEAAKQGWMTFVFRPGGVNNNPIPFLGTRNGVAVGLLMLVPMIAALSRVATRKWRRRGLVFLSFGVLYRGLSTFSRGALLAASSMGVMWWLRSRFKIRSLVAACLVIGLVLSSMKDEWWERMDTITTAEEKDERSALSRIHFWKVAIAMANDHPIWGVGVNGFPLHYDRYDSLGGEFGGRRAVHSSWFGVLAEVGYLGLAVFVVIILLALRSCWSVRRIVKKDPRLQELSHYSVGLETSIIAWAVGGAFTNFHYNEMLWNFIALSMVLNHLVTTKSTEEILGCVDARESHEEDTSKVSPAVVPQHA